MDNVENAPRRQLIENAFRQTEYFDNLKEAFADAFSSIDRIELEISLRDYVEAERLLDGRNYHEVEDSIITRILFIEADEYLAKAICNLCGGCISMRRGYISWGEVTTYYASFFAIHGLLRLQGKAIGTNYVLFPQSIGFPASILQHKYTIVRPAGNRRIHEDLWQKFFDTYSRNTEIEPTEYADSIFFTSFQDIVLEVERRNKFNYRMFESYTEIFDRIELDRRDLFDLKSADPMFFSRLTDYIGDTDRRYLAKAALRIRLLHSLLYSIIEDFDNLKEFFTNRHRQRIDFLDAVLISLDPIDRSSIEEGCLLIPT